jgi:aminopeptidase-like protein
MRLDILARLLDLNIGVTQSANADAFALMSSIYPLTIKRYRSGREHNGWVIPHEWRVQKALICHRGKVMFDGTVHPLAVAGYSTSFQGSISKAELDAHVFFRRELPDAYVFHSMYNYRPWHQHWGFCVPFDLFQTWPEGTYEIELVTEFVQADMLVGDAHIAGALPDTVVFNAHTCHPCQANDGLSGVMVILELFRWLSQSPRRYSYRAVLAPEHIGTVFYLADMPDAEIATFKAGCFIEMVGSDTPLVLQQSFTGQAIVDRVAEYVLKQVQPALHVGAFRTVVGNDETVWEAPGIEVPMVSISRWPYRQYHTSHDDMTLMSEARLNETLESLKRIVEIFEQDATMDRRFKGLVALSNPKYGLYRERPDPVVEKGLTAMDLRFGEVQDYLPRYFDGTHSIFDIAERFDVPFGTLRDYLAAFAAKGLIDIRPLPSLGHYAAGSRRPLTQ